MSVFDEKNLDISYLENINEMYEEILHDIKTPFSIVTSIISLLESYGPIDPTYDTYLKMMKNNCEQVESLLKLSNNLKNNQVTNLRPLYNNHDIVNLLHNTCISMSSLSRSKNIEILFTTIHEELIVYTDKSLIERMVMNLISNSIKFSDNSSKINVNLYIKIENEFVIKISDTGPGIEENNYEKIFMKYERVFTNNQVAKEGSGLGLYIVNSIVSSLNGKISISSNENKKGTIICISFPIHKSKALGLDENSENEDILFSV